MEEANYNLAMLILTIIGFIVTILALRRDNRKSNQETIEKIIEKTISDVKERKDIEKRVALLEQKIQLQDEGLKNELQELKEMISRWETKFYTHIQSHA